ncbi:MAG TPA: EamA family transporter [Candidatus Paceibacterota bacterium]|jgi:uncharacterized membrane protein|nr:EamA family transporter [Candidatus Paceibacterota bacterium]
MWFIFATLASAFWGLTYVLSEQIFKQISIPTLLTINAAIIAVVAFVASVATGNLKPDLAAIGSSNKLLGLIVAGALVLMVAEMFISLSITSKNATLAGLIEISYPLFIALFAYLLYKESQLTLPTAIGGLLILSGVIMIYWFSR